VPEVPVTGSKERTVAGAGSEDRTSAGDAGTRPCRHVDAAAPRGYGIRADHQSLLPRGHRPPGEFWIVARRRKLGRDNPVKKSFKEEPSVDSRIDDDPTESSTP
jgi:hypothetical protein